MHPGRLGLALLSALGWAVMDSNRAKLPVYLGVKSFHDYLAHTVVSYPTPPYAGYQFINEKTPANAKVLIYGESRGFYLNREAILSSPDQRTTLESWADQSAYGIVDDCRRMGCTPCLDLALGGPVRSRLAARGPDRFLGHLFYYSAVRSKTEFQKIGAEGADPGRPPRGRPFRWGTMPFIGAMPWLLPQSK